MSRATKLFPKLTVGAYSVKFHFSDEQRGERFFDTEYLTQQNPEQAKAKTFTIVDQINHRGERPKYACEQCYDSIGRVFRQNEIVTLHISKWTRRGKRHLKSQQIKILHSSRNTVGGVYIEYTTKID